MAPHHSSPPTRASPQDYALIIHPSAPLNSYVLNQVERCDPQHRGSYMLCQARTRIFTADQNRNTYFFSFTDKKPVLKSTIGNRTRVLSTAPTQ